jgi:hypothetical protein
MLEKKRLERELKLKQAIAHSTYNVAWKGKKKKKTVD